jgi:hypothetical protein
MLVLFFIVKFTGKSVFYSVGPASARNNLHSIPRLHWMLIGSQIHLLHHARRISAFMCAN